MGDVNQHSILLAVIVRLTLAICPIQFPGKLRRLPGT